MQTTPDVKQAQEMNKIMSSLESIPVTKILLTFLFYFLGGYLLYGALFGAVGAAVDNETDTQQFMLPLTIPLILSFVVAQSVVMKDPNGALAFWLSIIPFTSPIIMMVRMPFGVPDWQLFLSIGLLILGFIFTTWLAARIYRVGILMYGKKPTYAELSKWLFFKT
ncbi:MAG: ABC transporter permease, partial [Pedobacter sp.]